MQISISNTFKISVGEHEIILSRSDAEKLYQELGGALGKNATPTTLFRGVTTPSEFVIQQNRMDTKHETY